MLCGAPRFLVPPCTTSPFHTSSRKKILLVICMLSGTFVTMIAPTSAILFVRYRRKNVVPATIDLSPKRTPERISYYELLQATTVMTKAKWSACGCESVQFAYGGNI